MTMLTVFLCFIFLLLLLLLLKFINFVPSILFISIYFFMVMNIIVTMNAQKIMALVKIQEFQPVSE